MSVCTYVCVCVCIYIYFQYVLAARMNEWKCACILQCVYSPIVQREFLIEIRDKYSIWRATYGYNKTWKELIHNKGKTPQFTNCEICMTLHSLQGMFPDTILYMVCIWEPSGRGGLDAYSPAIKMSRWTAAHIKPIRWFIPILTQAQRSDSKAVQRDLGLR